MFPAFHKAITNRRRCSAEPKPTGFFRVKSQAGAYNKVSDVPVKTISIEELYRDSHKRLCQAVTAMIQDDYAAEDIVSDAFLMLMEERQRGHEHDPDLFLEHLIKLHCRHHLNQQQCGHIERAMEVKTDTYSDMLNEMAIIIEEEISRLPPQRRLIIISLFQQRLTSKEVARKMRLNRQTVLNQKTKGIAQLRRSVYKRFFG